MTPGEAVSEIFWRALKELPKKERDGVITRMLKDKEFMKELTGIIAKQRIKGASGSLYDCLADMGGKQDGG